MAPVVMPAAAAIARMDALSAPFSANSAAAASKMARRLKLANFSFLNRPTGTPLNNTVMRGLALTSTQAQILPKYARNIP